MHLHGPLVTLLCELAPEVYGPFMLKDKQGMDLLYIKIINALYGIMKVALLYYHHFIWNIKAKQFVLNPYDPCIANKMVDGKQLTLVWHINDIKASHVKEMVVTEFIEWLKHTYKFIFEDGSGAMQVSKAKKK